MLNKIFHSLLAVSLLVMTFLTYYSWSWLQSIGAPLAIVEHYDYYSEISWFVLWISWVALLIVANAILWSTRRSWAMWASFIYLAVFVVVRYFWLDEVFFTFKKANGSWQGGFSVGPFFAIGLCVAVAAIVFFDQFIVVRLSEKMHPKKAVSDELMVPDSE